MPSATYAGEYSIVGCWEFEIDMPFPASNRELTVCFSKESNGLTGKIRDKEKDKWVPTHDVSQQGNKFSFTTDSKNGKVSFSGTVNNAEQLKGDVRSSKGIRPFKAKRTTRESASQLPSSIR